MSGARFVIRPRPGADRVHDLLDATGARRARLEVASDRAAGRAVPVVGSPLTFARPTSVARVWEVHLDGLPLGLVDKPALLCERFEVVLEGRDPIRIQPIGMVGRRCWQVSMDRESEWTVRQGAVRRRWHELTATTMLDVRPGSEGERSLLVVSWILALVETRPTSGVRGLVSRA